MIAAKIQPGLRTHQFSEHPYEIVVHRAAQAAIVQHHDLLILAPFQILLGGHQLAVDIDLAKLRNAGP